MKPGIKTIIAGALLLLALPPEAGASSVDDESVEKLLERCKDKTFGEEEVVVDGQYLKARKKIESLIKREKLDTALIHIDRQLNRLGLSGDARFLLLQQKSSVLIQTGDIEGAAAASLEILDMEGKVNARNRAATLITMVRLASALQKPDEASQHLDSWLGSMAANCLYKEANPAFLRDSTFFLYQNARFDEANYWARIAKSILPPEPEEADQKIAADLDLVIAKSAEAMQDQ